jgi:hypothetical protein
VPRVERAGEKRVRGGAGRLSRSNARSALGARRVRAWRNAPPQRRHERFPAHCRNARGGCAKAARSGGGGAKNAKFV